MKKACLRYLSMFLMFAVCITGVLAVLWPPRPNVEPPRPPLVMRIGVASLAALFAAGVLTLAGAAADSVQMRLADRARVARSLAGERPEDGRKIAAAGTLVATGPALTAPFSGERCAAYHYEIKHTSSGSSSTTTTSCWGYGLTPSHVETPAGLVRLLAYTLFEFRAANMKGPEMLERARRHFASSQFVTIGLGALTSAWKEFSAVLSDDDGAIRADFGPPPENLESDRLTFEEQVVIDREPVCAFGTYSAVRGGLVPVPGTRDVYSARVFRGTGEQVRRKLLCSAVGQIVLALVCAGIAAGIGLGFLRLARTLT